MRLAVWDISLDSNAFDMLNVRYQRQWRCCKLHAEIKAQTEWWSIEDQKVGKSNCETDNEKRWRRGHRQG